MVCEICGREPDSCGLSKCPICGKIVCCTCFYFDGVEIIKAQKENREPRGGRCVECIEKF